MVARPTSISVIGWLGVVFGAIGLVALPLTFQMPAARAMLELNPVPVEVQVVISVVGTLVTMICGVAFLRGKDWGRTTYVAWSLAALVYALLTSPAKLALLPSVVVLAVVVYFLYRPAATEFFRSRA